MRKIKNSKWQAKGPEFDDDGKPTGKTILVDESLSAVLNILISNKDPKDIPRGIDKFRMFNRISKSFIKQKKQDLLYWKNKIIHF